MYERYKASSFEDYWVASKAWERAGLSLGTARALVNAGFLALDDLYTADDFELANVPRVGPKSLANSLRADWPEMPDAQGRRRKRQLTNRVRSKGSVASHGGN